MLKRILNVIYEIVYFMYKKSDTGKCKLDFQFFVEFSLS